MKPLYDYLILIEPDKTLCKYLTEDIELGIYNATNAYTPIMNVVAQSYEKHRDNEPFFKELISREIIKLYKILEA